MEDILKKVKSLTELLKESSDKVTDVIEINEISNEKDILDHLPDISDNTEARTYIVVRTTRVVTLDYKPDQICDIDQYVSTADGYSTHDCSYISGEINDNNDGIEIPGCSDYRISIKDLLKRWRTKI